MKLSTAMRRGMKRCRPTRRGEGRYIDYDKHGHLCGCALGTIKIGGGDLDSGLERIHTLPNPRDFQWLNSQIAEAFEHLGWSRRQIADALEKAGL
jgi:hypothetical protein